MEYDSENDQDESQDYSPDEEPSDDEAQLDNKKKSIPNDILWKMFETGVSFSSLSEILNLGFSVVGERDNFHLSASHLFKTYQKMAERKESRYKDEIRSGNMYGTLCFDHHRMKQLSGKFLTKEHRLAVLWHSNSRDRLISIDKMNDKTGRSQMQLILRACDIYGVDQSEIVAVSCDNESTNTGNDNGTCVLLEEQLLKPLLRLMCRHHIMEIVLKAVYRSLFLSETPINLFHPILVEAWTDIKSRNFPFGGFRNRDEELFDGEQLIMYSDFKELALEELQNQTRSPFPRDDYEEITSLSLKFLTGQPKILTKSNQVQFKTIQNPSNARFMASAIQGLNCFLFRSQLNWELQGREQIPGNLTRFCLFLTLIYVRYWNRSSILFDAGVNDLKFLQELQNFAILDNAISRTAKEAISRHLYYLSEELIVLSLFSDKVTENEKNIIAARLLEIDESLPERNFQSNHIKYNQNTEDWRAVQLIDLIGKRSLHLFQLLNLSSEFMNVDAHQWSTHAGYLHAKHTIHAALVCVNDGAERVISTCKSKYKRQRCKNDISFGRSMLERYY